MNKFEEMIRRLNPDLANQEDNNSLQNKRNTEGSLVKKVNGIGQLADMTSNLLRDNITSEISNAKNKILNTSNIEKTSDFDMGSAMNKVTGGIELASSLFNNASTNSYDTSAETGHVSKMSAMEIGSKTAEGAVLGMKVAGPLGAIVGGGLSLGTSLIGNKQARKDWANNVERAGKKESFLEKQKLNEAFYIEEGKQMLADLTAIKKKQLGYS